ncbi:MAG: hypothetical protein PQJ60_12890 [Spirochaetales bacterium]|nr:hypothetical protein [Spirochaetales bacterium]
MKKKLLCLLSLILLSGGVVCANGSGEADAVSSASQQQESYTIDDAAEELGFTTDELKAALGDPKDGPADMAAAAVKLGITEAVLSDVMGKVTPVGEALTVDEYTLNLNGIDVPTIYPVFSWADLPEDVKYERQPVQSYTNEEGETHYYEAVYVESGNLNWYQAAYLAQDAGGYLACPETDGENSFVFSLVNDEKYFWHFAEGAPHYGIGIGPFLGGYQPVGSVEPAGGWLWLSGEEWDYTNWAVNLDDGVIDMDPRNNTQPNNSGASQPIMGFGEMNLPVPTWGDYMEAVGAYGADKGPGNSYGFIIEYESNPN